MTRTMFTTSMDSEDYLNCQMLNDHEHNGANKNAQYTAPVIYYADIPLQVKYTRRENDFISVRCLLGGSAYWFCTLIFRSSTAEQVVGLSPYFNEPKFKCSVKHTIIGKEECLTYKFRLKLVNIVTTPTKAFPTTTNVPDDAEFIVKGSHIPFNRILLANRSKTFAAMFFGNPMQSRYEIENHEAEDLQEFLKLACFDPSFEFDETKIAALMNTCEQFSADQCMAECVNFLMRSERVSNIDACLCLEQFENLDHLMFNMTKIVNSEISRDNVTLWPTDFRKISSRSIDLMNSVTNNVSVRFPAVTWTADEIQRSNHLLNAKRTLNTSEGNRVYRWDVTIAHEYTDNKILTTITSDSLNPWFVDAEIIFTIHKKNTSTLERFEERLLATPETGITKYVVNNHMILHEISKVVIQVFIKRAFLNDIDSLFIDFQPVELYNFRVTVVNRKKNGEITETAFNVLKEVIMQSSDFFSSLLSARWRNGNDKEVRLTTTTPEMFEYFWMMAQRPNLAINDSNFLNLLTCANYFECSRMLARLEDYYRGQLISEKIRKEANKQFAVVFDQLKFDVYSNHECRKHAENEREIAEFWEPLLLCCR